METGDSKDMSEPSQVGQSLGEVVQYRWVPGDPSRHPVQQEASQMWPLTLQCRLGASEPPTLLMWPADTNRSLHGLQHKPISRPHLEKQ